MSKMKAENCSWAHIENVNIVCNLCLPFPFVASSALRPRLLCVTTTGLGGNKMFFFLLRCDFLPEEVYTMAIQKWQIDSQATVYLVLGGVKMMTWFQDWCSRRIPKPEQILNMLSYLQRKAKVTILRRQERRCWSCVAKLLLHGAKYNTYISALHDGSCCF